MELLKKNIRMLSETGRLTDQLTLEEDCIVPDSLPDAGRIVWKKAMIKMKEIQTDDGKAVLTGELQVQVLYIDDTPEHKMHRLDTAVPFQEIQMLPENASKENTQIQWKLEDISVSLINSRKVSIHGLIHFEFCIEENREIQAVVEMHGMSDVSTQRTELELLNLKHQKKDIFRIKEGFVLPSSKPTILHIIWDDMQLRGIEIRSGEGKLEIKGEILVFILYEGEEEGQGAQWLESAIPFQGSLEDVQVQPDTITRILVQMEHSSVEAENDYDGEKRQLSVEAALNLDIRLYEEEQADILKDVYSPVKELQPVREEQQFESLVMKNTVRIKAGGRLHLSSSQPRMLQLCSSIGEVNIDEIRKSDTGLVIEGAVMVYTLYVSSDDKIPYAVLEDAVPFQHTVEVPDLDDNCRINVQSHMEQMTVSMLDSETVEGKIVLSLELFIVRLQTENCITEVEIKEMDLKKIQQLPGLVGYIVQPEDTLWDIAKKYYTTPEKICELNEIGEKEIHPGLGLVIVKTVSPN